MKTFSILIPAYNPGKKLIDLVVRLASEACVSGIIIVNDGSQESFSPVFSSLLTLGSKISVLKHAINLGKGAALRTGLNYAYNHFSNDVGVVTADADGQHAVEDILRIGHELVNSPNALIIGTRQFNQQPEKKIPLRNRIGNICTTQIFKLIVGQKVSDTQSGLRGIPRHLITTLLKINNNGYEFELSMLIYCKHLQLQIREIPIKTIYFDNQDSHFNPLIDSLKIYFVLFRFLLLSFFTFLLDFSVFAIFSLQGFSILISHTIGRVIAIAFNYPLAKKMVFHCQTKGRYQFSKYISLVILNCIISFSLINFFISYFSASPIIIKILVESMFCIVNFAIQRDFIFTRGKLYEN